MADRDLVYLPIRLPRELYEQFKALVGPRHMSPTIRREVERFVEQERVKQAIDRVRKADQ